MGNILNKSDNNYLVPVSNFTYSSNTSKKNNEEKINKPFFYHIFVYKHLLNYKNTNNNNYYYAIQQCLAKIHLTDELIKFNKKRYLYIKILDLNINDIFDNLFWYRIKLLNKLNELIIKQITEKQRKSINTKFYESIFKFIQKIKTIFTIKSFKC